MKVQAGDMYLHKAENRMKGKPTDTKLSETLQGAEKRKRKYLFLQLGLKQEEIKKCYITII